MEENETVDDKIQEQKRKIEALINNLLKEKKVDEAEYAISVTGKDKKISVLHSRYWLTETSVYQQL